MRLGRESLSMAAMRVAKAGRWSRGTLRAGSFWIMCMALIFVMVDRKRE